VAERHARRESADATGLERLATLPERLSAAQPERLRAGLAGALPEVARGDLIIHDCHPRHFRLEQDVWTFQCGVTVGGPDGEREVWLEGSLRPSGAPYPDHPGQEAAFGSEGWSCLLPELGVELRMAPPDTSLPMLPHLTDAERARVLLEDAIRGGSPAYSDLRIATCRPQVMRYARGSRCTIRYEIDHGPAARGRHWPGVVVAKTYRRNTGEHTFHGMQALWSSELSRSSLVAIAEPLAYLPELRVLVQGPIAEEQTLRGLICASVQRRTPAALDEVHEYMARTARGLAALHGCGVAFGETVTLESEVTEIRTRIERLARLMPEVSGAAAPLLVRVLDLDATHPAEVARPSHGTFRPAQVLLHQGRVGFIDFDDFCQAEPALDVARFRAGIRDCWMRAQVAGDGIIPSAAETAASMTALEAVCDGFLQSYEDVGPVSRERVMLWETLDLLTDVLHAWTRMSPGRLLAGMLTLDDHLRRSGLTADLERSADPWRVDHPARRSTDLERKLRSATPRPPIRDETAEQSPNIDAGLRSLATLPPWLLAAAQPDRLRTSLARAVPDFAGGELLLHDCRAKHIRLQTTTWTFLCRVTVGAPGGERRDVWLEGSLHPPGTPQAAQETPVVAFGSERWRCLLPELGVELRTALPDTALALVPDLTNADRARVLLEGVIRAGSSAHADLRIAACRPRVMRHDRGSRCTVRYELDHPRVGVGRRSPEVIVAKTYGDDRGRNAYLGMRALWGSELSRSSAIAIAEPLAYVPELRLLVQGPVPGDRTLEELICSALPRGASPAVEQLDDDLRRTAEGLAALHGAGVVYGETVTLEHEVAGIRALVERLAGPVPELAGAAAPLLARVIELAAEHPAGRVRPSHGSFRPSQVLVHHGGIGFIDFDDFCQAEPAHDFARFRAAIRDCGMRTLLAEGDGVTGGPEAIGAALTAVEAVCEAFLRHCEAIEPVSRERVVLWEALDLLTYVLHAWTRTSAARLRVRMLTLDDRLRRWGLPSRVEPSTGPEPTVPRAA
jgi:Ser/Thr protein kinase RdoA (MazF antagonist)